MTLGEKLQYLRKRDGISQEQLASQMELSRQSVSKWESDSSLPDIAKIVRLSRLFGVSTDYLLKDEIEEDRTFPEAKEPARLEGKNRHKAFFITGAILSGIGLLGNLTLFVLSTMIKVHSVKTTVFPDGSLGFRAVTYDYWTFLAEYRLYALLWIFLAALLAGLVFLAKSRATCRRKKS